MRAGRSISASRYTYYEIKARSVKEAEATAEALFQKAHPTRQIPTVEVVIDDGVGIGYWDGLDSAIDDYKERQV